MSLFRPNGNHKTNSISIGQVTPVLENGSTTALHSYNNSPSTVITIFTKHENRFIAVFLLLLVFVKALVSLLLWKSGYVEYDADGFTRSLRAWDWSQHGGVQVDAWLPLQFWINGSIMHFWPDLLHVPRVVNFLASVVTTVNFFFIGYQLFGRSNAFFSSLLVALFPWEIWFGISGMSESLTNMFLSFGVLFFVRWLVNERISYLYWAGMGLLGATAVRYEAWFYSVIYVALVLYIAYRRKILGPKLLLPLGLPFLFIIYWMGLSYIQDPNHSPLYFADKTSELNHRLDNQNQQVSILERAIYYPRTLLELTWRLTIPAVIGSLLLIFKPVRVARVYLALIWGEFILFILTTLPYNNIAPGSARYPVSNLLLLMPVVIYLFQYVAGRLTRNWLRLAVQLILIVIIGSQLQIIFSRSNDFPSSGVRQASLWLKTAWSEGLLPQDTSIPIDLPPSSNSDYNAFYALSVLTNHPDNFRIYDDFNSFKEIPVSPENPPAVWIQLASALGPSNNVKVSEADDAALVSRYKEVLQFNEVKLVYGPFYKGAQTLPKTGNAQQTYHFQADDFQPGEQLDVWVSRDDNSIQTLGRFRADAAGKFTLNYKPDRATPGHWAITARGLTSNHYGIGRFDLTN